VSCSTALVARLIGRHVVDGSVVVVVLVVVVAVWRARASVGRRDRASTDGQPPPKGLFFESYTVKRFRSHDST